MNLVVLVGNLTRDPEVRYSANGNPVAHINIAVNRSFTREGGPDADFFRVTVFGKQAELVERYLSKGRKVGIEGRIENSNYEKEGKTVYQDSIIANRIEFLSPKGEGGGRQNDGGWSPQESGGLFDDAPFGGQQAQQAPASSAPTGGSAPPTGFSDLDNEDDLPF
ncbi:MAG: single-stranded DNA-binding protein [Clostridiales Family XIII bacterium]|jgi:single-strand DNA-binding protein|nr:single-stranded DNA-binding protein [Clostridiales Family XIII bacterium]